MFVVQDRKHKQEGQPDTDQFKNHSQFIHVAPFSFA
jgi:hypothetical protein